MKSYNFYRSSIALKVLKSYNKKQALFLLCLAQTLNLINSAKKVLLVNNAKDTGKTCMLFKVIIKKLLIN